MGNYRLGPNVIPVEECFIRGLGMVILTDLGYLVE